jgi:ADP-ribose pyrophosphatase YjhB (NUDIX family)
MITLQVGVKAFLKNKEGKFLLIKRSPIKYPSAKGSWDIVGGRIDPGSPLLDNLKREIKEEAKLEIIGQPKLIAAQDIIPNPEKHVVRLTYIAETNEEPILDTEENIEYKWLTASELKNHEDLDIYVKKVLESDLIT